MRRVRELPHPESALVWADALAEANRPVQADLTLGTWVDTIGTSAPVRFRLALEYAHWLRARLAMRAGPGLPATARDEYLAALRNARFPFLEAPGWEPSRTAWNALTQAVLTRDWAAVAPAADALAASTVGQRGPGAADLSRFAALIGATAARVAGDPQGALAHFHRSSRCRQVTSHDKRVVKSCRVTFRHVLAMIVLDEIVQVGSQSFR